MMHVIDKVGLLTTCLLASILHSECTVKAFSPPTSLRPAFSYQELPTSLSRIKKGSNLNMANKELDSNLKIVIAGAGVIGTSTAYYLAKNHQKNISSITLIDPTGSIAPAASGKAGGFLALDWNDHSPAGPLTRRSFDLHQDLADTLGADNIMYRRLTCASISVDQFGEKRRPSGKKLEGIEWVDDAATRIRPLGDEHTIAQVHPLMLCKAMWENVQEKDGFESLLRCGRVVETVYKGKDAEKKLVGAKLDDGTIIDADIVLFACGPWTEFGKCMLGVKYHSVIIPTRPRVLNQSVFFDGFGDPEVYPRPDGTAYCTGFPDPAIHVTELPGQEEVRDDAIQMIVNAVRRASGGEDAALGKDPELSQSCYLPTTVDGLPMIGQLPKTESCFVAAGHGCWGILMGPATGEAMASLMVTGKSTNIDLSPFRPGRFEGMEML